MSLFDNIPLVQLSPAAEKRSVRRSVAGDLLASHNVTLKLARFNREPLGPEISIGAVIFSAIGLSLRQRVSGGAASVKS